MAELMLVNPRKRRRKSRRRLSANPRRRRSTRRKLTALQAKYFGGGRKRRTHKRRRSVARAVRAAAPRRHRRRRMRGFLRNTSGSARLGIGKGLLKGTIIPAALGGAGALAVDVIWGIAPVPASLKTGTFAPLVKAAGAIGIGILASKFLGREMGAKITSGYLTVAAYNIIKAQVQKAMPTLTLGDYPYGIGYVQAGQFVPDNPALSSYITPDQSQMSEYLGNMSAEEIYYH